MKKKTRTTTATRKKTTYPRKKGFGLGGFFKMPDVKQDLPKAAAVVGGVIIARFVGGQLDKFILSKSVGDITGIEVQANVAKYLKPAIISLGGLATMNYGKKGRNDIIFNVGLGITAYGASGVLQAITSKAYLQGFGANAAEEYAMFDASGNKIGMLDTEEMKKLLPDLEGTDDYNTEEDYSINSIEGMEELAVDADYTILN